MSNFILKRQQKQPETASKEKRFHKLNLTVNISKSGQTKMTVKRDQCLQSLILSFTRKYFTYLKKKNRFLNIPSDH